MYYCLCHWSMHRWSFGPVVIRAFWAFFANNFEWRIAAVNFWPVMIDTVWVSWADLLDGRAIIPIMLKTVWPIFANQFLLGACITHLLHVSNVLFGVAALTCIWSWSDAWWVVMSTRICDGCVFVPAWHHQSKVRCLWNTFYIWAESWSRICSWNCDFRNFSATLFWLNLYSTALRSYSTWFSFFCLNFWQDRGLFL